MRAPALCLAAMIATSPAPLLAAEEKRELGRHEHGHVTLEIAVDGDRLTMALEAPGESIVGFEHAAETDEQKAAVEAAKTQLADASALFAPSAKAGCTNVSSFSAAVSRHRKKRF